MIFSLVNTTTVMILPENSKERNMNVTSINVNIVSNDYEEKLTASVGKILYVGNMAFQTTDSFQKSWIFYFTWITLFFDPKLHGLFTILGLKVMGQTVQLQNLFVSSILSHSDALRRHNFVWIQCKGKKAKLFQIL